MATTTNYSWTTPDDTDLVKDGAAAIRSLGTAIDSTVFTNAGAAITKATVDAKGDLIAGTADNTVDRLAVGANGTILVADSATSTGLKWATPAGGGKVLQVVGAVTTTATTIASTSYTDTTITATITPTLASSKVLVLINGAVYYARNSFYQALGIKLFRDASLILENNNADFTNIGGATSVDRYLSLPVMYVDSPATTSAITYKIQGKVDTTANSGTSTWQHASTPSTITLLEIGA